MKKLNRLRRSSVALALLSGFTATSAFAHGPVIVLSKDGSNQIITNLMDVTPQSDSTNPADYPIGSPSRIFPSGYNVSNFGTFAGSAYAANTPQNMQAIPMVLVTSGSIPANTGYYGQLEVTDAEGNASLNTGPGYAYGNGGFAASTVLQVVFADKLKRWNSASGTFTATPNGEQLQAIRSTNAGAAYANTLTSNGVQGGTGLQVTVSASQNGGSHSQLSYRLMDSLGDSTDTAGIADGLYLANFQIGTASTSPTSLTTSLPYYLVFEKNVSGNISSADLTAANNYISANLVPEPTSLGLAGLASTLLLGRRRRTTR